MLIMLSVAAPAFLQLPFYESIVNVMWNALWCGLLLVAGLLVALEANISNTSDPTYADTTTWVSNKLLASCFCFVVLCFFYSVLPLTASQGLQIPRG
jgi:hypothetical protein